MDRQTPPEPPRDENYEASLAALDSGYGDGESEISNVVSFEPGKPAAAKKKSRPKPVDATDQATPDSVVIGGAEKRITTLAQLNERYALLEAPGSAPAYVERSTGHPLQDICLKRKLAPEVVITGRKDNRPFYASAYNFWTGHARRHVYRRIAFTSKEVPGDTLNLCRGLGVTPKAGPVDLILTHIREVICAGDVRATDYMIKLLAWQIQNIGRPSKIIVALKTKKQQAGKGLLLEQIMLRIYGPSGVMPATADQVLGRFNDALRGASYIFLDEVLFAGDRRAADQVKKLSTGSVIGIETKGVPIVQCPIGVNFWLASNHDNAAHIEEGDARHWVLNVSENRIGDAAYFSKLSHQIENGGREAFAHHLLTLDVAGFVPWRDIEIDTAARSDMIRESINPHDARKWIEACCAVEQIIGTKDLSTGSCTPWIDGEAYSFAELAAAYSVWVKDQRSARGAQPTPLHRLGEVLTAAGFGTKKTKTCNLRVLPKTDACIALLWRRPKDGS